MSNVVQHRSAVLPANVEAQNIAAAAEQDAGFYKLLKFRKGHYFIDGDEVALGTQFTAHAVGWTKCWIKFVGRNVIERKIYRVLARETPPDREALGDLEQSKWEISEMTRQPQDPWILQYQLPMEDEHGEIVLFIASSFGGKRAVADVCSAWARRNIRDPQCGQPIVRLRETMMPSKRYGDVPRPSFEVTGWDGLKEAVREVKAESVKGDMDDEIPF